MASAAPASSSPDSIGIRADRRGWPRASYHHHSAVDVKGLAGHVGRLLAREVKNAGGDVGGAAQALRRNVLAELGHLLLVQRIGHRRLDEARRHAVGGDAAV